MPPTPSLEPYNRWNPNLIRKQNPSDDESGFDSTPLDLEPRTIAEMSENGYWCFPCAEEWFEKNKG